MISTEAMSQRMEHEVKAEAELQQLLR
eukprot:SAG31_NODE_30637_length_378_cov_0.892473_1_plen_26_part_01